MTTCICITLVRQCYPTVKILVNEMVNIPLTVIIAFFGIFITALFQRRHWLRTTREEIRVRETKEASDLVRDISRSFDKRISAQRLLLLNLKSSDREKYRESFRLAVIEYAEGYNDIRYRLFFYTSYQRVLDFERNLHERLVHNSDRILSLMKQRKSQTKITYELNDELSKISANVFHFCTDLSTEIAAEKFGTLRMVYDWRNPKNEFVTSWYLVKRLLNI